MRNVGMICINGRNGDSRGRNYETNATPGLSYAGFDGFNVFMKKNLVVKTAELFCTGATSPVQGLSFPVLLFRCIDRSTETEIRQ